MIASLLTFLSTIAASVIHGGDYLRFKVLVMLLHASTITGALWMAGVTSYGLLVTFPITAIYWFLFRTGSQAKAELDAMAGIGKLTATVTAYIIPLVVTSIISGVTLGIAGQWVLLPISAVPFLFLWVPPLACKLFPYGSHVWPATPENLKFQRKQRMKVEALVGAFPSGLAIGILVYAVSMALRGI